MREWVRTFLAWDGILPVAVSTVPFAVKLMFPKSDIAAVSTIILIPIFATLIRTGIGARQIRNCCDGDLPIIRQIALGVAIALLMLFEGTVSLLTFADDEPLSAWLYPAGFYIGYLAAIAWALAPRLCPDGLRIGDATGKPNVEIPPGTLNNILKQAGLKK